MGLFGWFGKKSTVTYEDDRIWLRRKATLEGLRSDLTQRLGEDAVFRRSGSGWVATVLTSLGMKEDEAVSARMVTKRLKQAQQKLERDTFRNLPAESADEWYRLNVRDAVE